jgi:splicing factor 3A subunit 3
MSSLLEYARSIYQEMEELEQNSAQLLLQKSKTHKDSIYQQTKTFQNIQKIQTNCEKLLEFYDDKDGMLKREVESKDFAVFYERLKELKDFYAGRPNELAFKDGFDYKEEEMKDLECNFTGEETLGRHLDLHSFYLEYLNLKGVDKISYLVYLNRFERTKDISQATKSRVQYLNYLNHLKDYLIDWLRRSRPLFNRNALLEQVNQEFAEMWENGTVPNWPKPEINQQSDLYCLACDKTFTKKTVFDSHLTGKKHIKGLEKLKDSSKDDKTEKMINSQLEDFNKKKPIAEAEFIIQKLTAHLAQVREDTKAHVERKQALTEKERVIVILKLVG